MRLKNKVALLAGVGSGMGRAAAILFSQEGGKIAVNARQIDHLDETGNKIKAAGGDVILVQGDVSNRIGAETAIDKVISKYGRLDILYCGAGGNFDPSVDFSDIDPAFHQETIDNTINTLYSLSQAARPVMKSQGGGSIVSIAASFNVRQAGNASYGAAKGGVIGLATSLAGEFYKDDIRVNVVLPGLFRGSLGEGAIKPAANTLARTGFPEDVAYAALYLASDESAWVTGETLSVDGGVDVGTRPLWEFDR